MVSVRERQNGKPRCERSCMAYIHVRHSLSSGSSLERLHRKSLPRNQPKKSLRQQFQATERLITDQTEINGLTTIDWQQPMWRETTLLFGRAVQFATAKAYVFSDSVLCLGGINDEPVKAWESKIKWIMESRYVRGLDRIDGEPMEFEWKISQDSLHCEFSTRFKK